LNSSIVVASRPEERHGVSFREAFWVWLRVAALSFGGPAGQIAVMHRILVEEKRWIGETRFLHALNYCMLLPGPEAQQLAVYIGWLLHRIPGGLVAGTLFILPGYISLMVLSWLYAAYGEIGPIQALFFGLKAAVLAIVVEAVFKVGKRALKNRVMIGLAGLSFITIFFFHAPFPLIILAAALAAFRHPGVLDPMVAGALGGTLAKWTTFVPCFLWIFLGGPYMEALRGNKALTASLSAITAAVVGVILNLAIWFAIHTIFHEVEPVRAFLFAFDAPKFSSVDPWALLLSVGAAVAIFRFKVGMIQTLAACCLGGIVFFYAGML
jgi:chromate transport protein ChrA